MDDIANVSIPLIAVLLIMQALLPWARKPKATAPASPERVAEATTAATILMGDRIDRIDRRTESMEADIASLTSSVVQLSNAVNRLAQAVERNSNAVTTTATEGITA